jgi:hypothetical protein
MFTPKILAEKLAFLHKVPDCYVCYAKTLVFKKNEIFFPPKIRKKIVGKSDHNIDPRFWTSSIILRTSNRFK